VQHTFACSRPILLTSKFMGSAERRWS